MKKDMPKRKVTEIMILDKLERQTQIIVVYPD